MNADNNADTPRINADIKYYNSRLNDADVIKGGLTLRRMDADTTRMNADFNTD
jgi:hypothetical protein